MHYHKCIRRINRMIAKLRAVLANRPMTQESDIPGHSLLIGCAEDRSHGRLIPFSIGGDWGGLGCTA